MYGSIWHFGFSEKSTFSMHNECKIELSPTRDAHVRHNVILFASFSKTAFPHEFIPISAGLSSQSGGKFTPQCVPVVALGSLWSLRAQDSRFGFKMDPKCIPKVGFSKPDSMNIELWLKASLENWPHACFSSRELPKR